MRAALLALLLVLVPTAALAQPAEGEPPPESEPTPPVEPVPAAEPAPPPTSAPAFDPAPVASAQRVVWDPVWPRFRPIEYVLTAAAGTSAVLLFMFGPAADHAKWDGPILFDKPVRNALRVHGREDLTAVRRVGDVLTIAPVVYVTAIDSLLVPGLDGSFDVAWQMTMMNAQAFSLSGLVAWSMFATVGRARPSHRECNAKTTDDPLCLSGTFADFPSGHTMTAFTAAGLSCAHHTNLNLYGSKTADLAACLSTVAMGAGSGLFRIIGDRHYVSDVIVGAGLGFAFGFGLPSLLHYRGRSLSEVYSSPSLKVGMGIGAGATAAPAPAGANVFGVF